MTENLIDTLDLALERLQVGEPLSTILADYPAEAETLGPLLEAAATLDNAAPVEVPTPADLQADRADFLAQVTNLQQQAVSPGLFGRLKEGIVHTLPWFTLGVAHSEGRQRRMSTLAIKAMLVFGLLFGSAGATAAMAANSLPDSPLYPVKLALEDARLAVTSGPDQQAQFHLAMAEERTEEMAQQALNGDVPGEATVSRLQLHLNEAFRLASQLSDEELAGVLTQARTQIRTQAEEMNQVQEQAGEPAQEPLRHAYQLLKQAEGEADVGLHNQQQFRFQFGPPQVEEPVPPEEPVPLEGAEPAPAQNPDAQPDCAPDCPGGEGAQHQYHGRESDTLPGNAYGEPQPCDPTQEECGDQNQHGQLEPEPGEHGHLYGQETNDNGPAGPPVDPGCGDDCVPAGNQNQEPNQEQKNQEQNQEQNQVQQPGPNGNDDNGQNGSLIGPGGSPAPGSGGSNDNGSGSDNGGSDSSGGNGAKNGGGNK